MLQLKNVREVVREDNDDPTGVVVTQVIDDQKFIVYASTSKLCQLNKTENPSKDALQKAEN